MAQNGNSLLPWEPLWCSEERHPVHCKNAAIDYRQEGTDVKTSKVQQQWVLLFLSILETCINEKPI